MNASQSTSSESGTAPQHHVQRFSAVRMPLEEPVDSFAEAVEKLQACSSTELRRARQHHRRALEALRDGGYSALSENTRNNLVSQLQSNLRALNQAIDATSGGDPSAEEGTTDAPAGDSFSSRFRALFQGLW